MKYYVPILTVFMMADGSLHAMHSVRSRQSHKKIVTTMVIAALLASQTVEAPAAITTTSLQCYSQFSDGNVSEMSQTVLPYCQRQEQLQDTFTNQQIVFQSESSIRALLKIIAVGVFSSILVSVCCPP